MVMLWHSGYLSCLCASARGGTICMAPEAADVIIKVELLQHNIGLQQCQRHSPACLPFCSLRSMSEHLNSLTVLSAAGRSR